MLRNDTRSFIHFNSLSINSLHVQFPFDDLMMWPHLYTDNLWKKNTKQINIYLYKQTASLP